MKAKSNKNRVYLVQVSAGFGGSLFLPYAVGCLAAYAFSIPEISDCYELSDILYEREEVDQSLQKIKDPFLVGFSSYVWNHEYNLALARKVKERYPKAIVLFGGHNLPMNDSFLEENPFIDLLIFDEGEEPFAELLRCFIGLNSLSNIRNIAYRNAYGGCVMNTILPAKKIDYPSPYTSGVFDKIVEDKSKEFVAIFETNRGCPFRCAYCDWDTLKEGVRQFPMEKIKSEITWIAEHRIEFTWLIDGNFGLYKRDEEIVDFLIETKNKYGYPKRTNLFFTKNDPSFVYKLNKRLHDAQLSKGACISFQSLCPQVLKNIGRDNISTEKFKQLMTLYNTNGIPTFTELIVGLPGETYESFCDGIGELLDAGQHYSFYVYPCELLPNSIMDQPEYRKKYGIQYVTTTLNQHHREVPKDSVEEFSRIVVGTNDMSPEMWVQACLFSVCVRAFHSLGVLQFIALYLKQECNIKYTDFYQKLLRWLLTNQDTVGGGVFTDLLNRYNKIISNEGSFVYTFPQFGDVVWPFEEGVFLQIVVKLDRFFEEIYEFLENYFDDKLLFSELILYQKQMIKVPGSKSKRILMKYDFPSYFHEIICNGKPTLKKQELEALIIADCIPEDWVEFAREVVWYGRKGGKTLFIDNIQVV